MAGSLTDARGGHNRSSPYRDEWGLVRPMFVPPASRPPGVRADPLQPIVDQRGHCSWPFYLRVMTGGIEYRKRRMGVVVQQGELIMVPDARILTSRDDERRGGERGSASVFGRLGQSCLSSF